MASSRNGRAARGANGGEAALDTAPLEGHLGFLLRLAQQRVFEEFHRRFGAEGLTPARYSVLVLLAANPDARQVALAEALQIKQPNLVVLIHAMEAEGLVERREDATNRRANLLRLTPAGAALLARMEPAVRAMDAGFWAELPEAEREALFAALRRVLRS